MRDHVDVARRKEQLIARCAAQRAAIGADFRNLERPAALADRALAVVRFVRAHPVLVGAALAALTALRGRKVAGLLGRGLAAWRLYRSLAGWMHRFGVRVPGGPPEAGSGHVSP